MNKLAILYTSFLRDELMYKTVQSIIDNAPDNSILLIGDQNPTTTKANKIYTLNKEKINYYGLDYDCGLSASRNILAQEAQKLGCDYCLLTADSINFTQKYNFEPIVKLLESDPKNAICGFSLKNRVNWEFNIRLVEGDSFYLEVSNEHINFENIDFHKVEICREFFLAKTSVLNEIKRDENLKMMQHMDYFWRIKQAGYNVFHTNTIEAEYINFKPPEYKVMRDRMYTQFADIFMKKYNIKRWIRYGKGVTFNKGK